MTDSALPREAFDATRWTLVRAAAGTDTPAARAALSTLYQTYWYPLYAYARRKGYRPADAEDLTQGYFARLLQLESLADVSRDKGRFRSFLLAGLNHFIADAWDRASAGKRDVRRTVSLDTQEAETRYQREPVEHETPEHLFERKWALALLATVVQRLQREQEAAGKGPLFMALRFTLTGDRHAVPYATLATDLGLSEEAVRTTVHRLRRRYREVLREEIAHTVTEPAEIDEELHHLRRILAGT